MLKTRVWRRRGLWMALFVSIWIIFLICLNQEGHGHGVKAFSGENSGKDQTVAESREFQVMRWPVDTRPEECQQIYSEGLLKSTIVVMAFNKTVDSITRTLESIFTNTPTALMSEVMVIISHADGGIGKILKRKFKTLKMHFLPVSSQLTVNTFQQKLLTVPEAKGPILVFLDAAMVVNRGWLEPLVMTMKDHENTVAVSQVDQLSYEISHQWQSPKMIKMMFSWTLKPVPYELAYNERIHLTSEAQPISMSAIDSRVFAIRKMYATRLINLNSGQPFTSVLMFSTAIWRCGGGIVTTACSRVTAPLLFPSETDDSRTEAVLEQRLVKKYKQLLLASGKQLESNDNQKSAKITQNALQCKDFDWYINNVANDPFGVPPQGLKAYGQMRTEGSRTCFQLNAERVLIASKLCSVLNQHQIIRLTKEGRLMHNNLCASYGDNWYISFVDCSSEDRKQIWMYNEHGQLRNSESCMTHVTDPYPDTAERQIVMAQQCLPMESQHTYFQIWQFTMVFNT